MTPGEFKEIAKTMREYGIGKVKMGNVEFELTSVQVLPKSEGSSVGGETSLPEGVSIDPSDPIRHKVDELASLMKLSDKDLVDQLFPDKTEESA